MFKCKDCGHLFEEGEQGVFRGGNGWDEPEYREEFCPVCKGEFEEAIICKCCDEWVFEEESTIGICEDCIKKYSQDFDFCEKAFSEMKESVELNKVYTWLFSEEEIEAILKNHIKKGKFNADLSELVEQYAKEFAKKIKKEVRYEH